MLAKALNRLALTIASRLLVTLAEALNRLAMSLASLLMVLIFIVAGLGVIFRYGLQHSLPWADEAAAYLFIWLIFLGAASEVWTDGHPAMHLFEDRLPPRLRRAAQIIATLTIGVWGGVLVFAGIKAVILEAPESMSSIPGISLQLPYAAIPVCGALIIIFALAKLRTR
jgi:TRAP-type C4-dicarboxylate transport system permease small subunit